MLIPSMTPIVPLILFQGNSSHLLVGTLTVVESGNDSQLPGCVNYQQQQWYSIKWELDGQ